MVLGYQIGNSWLVPCLSEDEDLSQGEDGLMAWAIVSKLTSLACFAAGVYFGGFGGDYAKGAYYIAMSVALDMIAQREAKKSGLE